MISLHLGILKLPFHWDELGQFAPASLDLYQNDRWWRIHRAQRSSAGRGGDGRAHLAPVPESRWFPRGSPCWSSRRRDCLFSFLLAIRLCRGAAGAPAFAAVLFLDGHADFFSQSEMILLDMPAMTFTALALLLFLDERYAACAVACTALVLIKETFDHHAHWFFGAWLLFREKKNSGSALFFRTRDCTGRVAGVLLHYKDRPLGWATRSSPVTT